MTDARSIALDVLDRVCFDDAYSHIALSNALDTSDLSGRDRGLTTELVYGVLARRRTLDVLLGRFVDRPLDDLDRPVLLSLRMAAYQLMFLDRIPDHAIVDEAVELSKTHCGGGAAGFTNGVLRSILRDSDDWEVWNDVDPDDDPVRYLGIRHSLPDWLAARLIDTYGVEEAMRHAASFNKRPPLYFRHLDGVVDDVADDLEAVDTVPGAFRTEAMTDELAAAVEEGTIVVQDLGSQLVGHYSEPGGADRILDACAGMGGKTLLFASLTDPETRIVAVEPHRSKLDRLEASAKPTQFSDRIEVLHGKLDDVGADETFDLVLVDAPCSGLGVIRRHPETRWRRTPEDIDNRARLQTELLDQAAEHVADDGFLVYSVCSFTPEEGPERIDAFLQTHGDFERHPPSTQTDIDWSAFVDDRGDLRLNPADHDTDAFYAARLRRNDD